MKGISEISQPRVKRTLLTLLAIALVGSSCSFTDDTSDAPAAEVDFDSGTKPEPEAAAEATNSQSRDRKWSRKVLSRRVVEAARVESSNGGGSADPTGDRKAGGKDGEPGPGTATTKAGGELQKPEGRSPRPQGPVATVSRVKDPVPDAETRGDAPDYVEITEASITGHPENALFSITFAGDIPRRMPDKDSVAYVSFSLEREGRDYSVNASCERDGWRANVNGGDSFPGGFSIRGKTLSMTVPWGSIGGKKPFDWRVDSSWTRSTLTDTYYAFDSAPNDYDKRYR